MSDRSSTLRVATLVRALTAAFLLTTVLDGPLRYVLAAKKLIPLIYLPKILLLLAIPCLIVGRFRLSRGFVAGGAVIALALVWGAANLPNPQQALFGLWVLVPLLYGLLVTRYMLDEPVAYRRLFWLLFVVVVAGVLLNPLFNYPWVGASLDIEGTTIEISRQWTASGIDRYAGFSRASFSAASQILAFAIWLVATGRRRLHKLMIWIVAGAGIALTTSKGPVAAWLVLTLFFVSGALFQYRKSWRRVWTVALCLVLATVVLLPLTTLLIHYEPKLDSLGNAFLFASFGDRLNWMWPNSLGLLQDGAEWIIGRGLGGIGMAQQYFEPSRYLAADNMFVYLAVDIGPLFAAALLWIVARGVLTAFIRSSDAVLVFAIFMFIAVYGLVVNIFEEPFLSFLLGTAVSATIVKSRPMVQ